MKEFFSDPTLKLALAGAAGGIVRWFTIRDRMWPDGIINIVVGMLCAVYLAPVAVPLLGQVVGNVVGDAEQLSGLSGFLIGVGGLTVSGFIIDFWRTRKKILNDE